MVEDVSQDELLNILEKAQEAGDDILSMACSLGEQAQTNMDTGRWLIGDLALMVAKRYGKNTLQEFADSINVPVARVREYRTTAAFWDRKISVRTEYLAEFPTLTYTHFRQAMKLKDLDDAQTFLLRCADNGWKSEAAALEVRKLLDKPEPPAKLLDAEGTLLRADQRTGELVIMLDGGAISLDALQGVGEVVIKIYEAKAA